MTKTEHIAWIVEEEKARKDLYFALRTRVLTNEEMERVEQYDYRLLAPVNSSYSAEEIKRTFNEALLQQFKIRLAVERALTVEQVREIVREELISMKNGGA